MDKSESPTRVSAVDPARLCLVEVPAGAGGRIVDVRGDATDALAREGLVPGAYVQVERRVALGGPIILRLGRVRLAVARTALRSLTIELDA